MIERDFGCLSAAFVASSWSVGLMARGIRILGGTWRSMSCSSSLIVDDITVDFKRDSSEGDVRTTAGIVDGVDIAATITT